MSFIKIVMVTARNLLRSFFGVVGFVLICHSLSFTTTHGFHVADLGTNVVIVLK